MQDDIEEVNKAARAVKLRLERLDKANEASLARKARALHSPLPVQALCCRHAGLFLRAHGILTWLGNRRPVLR